MEEVICQVFLDLSSVIQQRQGLDGCGEALEQYPVNIKITGGVQGNVGAQASPFYVGWNVRCPNENLNGRDVRIGRVYHKINGGSYVPFPETTIDGIIEINTGIDWYYGEQVPLPPGSTQVDMYSVILHEALHLLGFSSTFNLGTTNPFYTLWDQNLFATSDYIPGGGSQSPEPVLLSNCVDNCWSRNTSIFLINSDFNEAVFENCIGSETLDIVFGNDAIAPISGGNGTTTSDDDEFRQMLSHLNILCNGQNEDYVMAPGFDPGDDNRIISQPELDILCRLGYKLNTCNEIFNINNFDRLPFSVADTEECCKPDLYACVDLPIILMGTDLLCNDITIGTDHEVTNVWPDDDDENIISVTPIGDDYEISSNTPGIYDINYTTTIGECIMHDYRFQVIFDYCPPCNNDPCENLVCADDFEDSPISNSTYFGFPFRFADSGSYPNGDINNSPQ